VKTILNAVKSFSEEGSLRVLKMLISLGNSHIIFVIYQDLMEF
jgi:hypothetical protein